MTKPLNHWVAIVSGLLLFSSLHVNAALIQQTVNFETQQTQSLWSTGTASDGIKIEQFIGARWGKYSDPKKILGITFQPTPDRYTIGGFVGGQTDNACIGVVTSFGCAGFRTDIDTTTGVEVQITTSGRIGAYAGAEISAGGIDVSVPMNTTIQLPDTVEAGQYFQVTTAAQTAATGANITAKAPSFRGYVDGVFDTENRIYGKGCVVGDCLDGEVNLNVNLGRFDLLEVDTSKENPWSLFGQEIPGLPVLEYTQRAPSPLDPDGIEQTPGGLNLSPILLEVEAKSITDSSGATVTGNNLSLNANHEIIDVDFELLGIMEAFFPIANVGILSNRVEFVDVTPFPAVEVGYDIASVSVGPVYTIEQAFNFEPKPAVQLKFDVPVTARKYVIVRYEWKKVGEKCTLGFFCEDILEYLPVYEWRDVVYQNGIVNIQLGDSISLRFDQGIGQLVEQRYYMGESFFSNQTSLALALQAEAKLGCINITGIGEGCLVSEDFVAEISQGTLSTKRFALQGFNDLTVGNVFSFNNQNNDDQTGGSNGEPTQVPEPGTFMLMLLGLAGLFLSSRNGRRRQTIRS